MIISFESNETKKIWNGVVVRKPAIEILQIGRRKRRMLNNVQDLINLRIPPSNRLEKLSGNLKNY